MLPSGKAFPAHAPNWWPARVSTHEQENPVVHGVPVSNTHEKARPAHTHKTRGATDKKTASKHDTKSEAIAPPYPSAASSAAPDAVGPNARAVLVRAARAVMDAVEQTQVACKSVAGVADEEADSDDNAPALRAHFGDPDTLSDEHIRQCLDTLDRQRVRYLRTYAQSTERAAKASVNVNHILPDDDADFDREAAIVTLHALQEYLVAARVDGAYLDIIYRNIDTLTDILDERAEVTEPNRGRDDAARVASEGVPTDDDNFEEHDDAPTSEADNAPNGEADDAPTGEANDAPTGEANDTPTGEADEVSSAAPDLWLHADE
ncbi:hypothetical protein C8Q79DRAFT_1015177 [Trametes meyenii]|nr:hypothetical protein C8Q79DRAFT_1015177 [Trametes meyenii]